MAQAQQRTVYRTMRRIAGVTLRCVRGTGQGVAHTYSNSAMTGRVARPSVSNSHFKQRPSVRLLAAHLARVLPFASRLRKDEGAGKAGRRLAPAGPCAMEMHTGWTTGVAGSPGLPCAMVLTCPSCSPRGAMHYCPRRPADHWCACPVGPSASPQDLTHRLRASGPHDLFVRARLRWNSGRWRVLTLETMQRRCQRRVVRATTIAHGQAALQRQPRPTPSRPSRPNPQFVTIAIRPLSWVRVFLLYDKSEFR